MKLLVNKDNLIALKAYADDANVAQDKYKLLDPAGVMFHLGTDGAVLYKNVTLPTDFVSGKYLYDGSTFTPNPAYRTRAQRLSDPKDAEKLAEETR